MFYWRGKELCTVRSCVACTILRLKLSLLLYFLEGSIFISDLSNRSLTGKSLAVLSSYQKYVPKIEKNIKYYTESSKDPSPTAICFARSPQLFFSLSRVFRECPTAKGTKRGHLLIFTLKYLTDVVISFVRLLQTITQKCLILV